MKLIIAGGISFALVFLLWTSVIAQQPTKMPRLGYLSSRDPGSDAARTEAVKAGLQELGYTDGQNLNIEYRFAHGKRERFPSRGRVGTAQGRFDRRYWRHPVRLGGAKGN